jgi:hypothetical protein
MCDQVTRRRIGKKYVSAKIDSLGLSHKIEGNFEPHERWNDVPRGTMDEVSSRVRLDPPFV